MKIQSLAYNSDYDDPKKSRKPGAVRPAPSPSGLSVGGGGSSGITVGTTTITSGSNTKVLFNNSGVVGEYTITGTGNVVMSASPTLTGTAALASATLSGTLIITNNGGTIFAAGRQGTTNPAFSIITSDGSDVTGVSVTAAAAGSRVVVKTTSSGSAESLVLAPKGNAPVYIQIDGGAGSTDPALVVSRSINNVNGTGNAHAFVDATVYSRTNGGPNGFNSFDTPVVVGSSGSTYDHYVSFQARPYVDGAWADIYGGYFVASFANNASVTRNTGLWLAPPNVGTGVTITNNIGVYVDGTTAPGAYNYSLMSTGVSYFMNHAGAVSLGSTTNPSTALHIRGNATRESLIRFTPNVNANFVGTEWTDNANVSVLASLKLNASSGELRHYAGSSGYYQTFYTNNVERLKIDTSGHVLASTDNTYDLGASGASRFRTGYFGTNLASPVHQATALTVATLPSAATYPGGIAYVTDANATTRLSTVVGGGSNKVIVFSDGTNWLIL